MRRQDSAPPTTFDLERLRWLGVWVPVAGVGFIIGVLVAVIILRDDPNWKFHATAYVLIMGLIAAGAYLFSSLIFRMVRSKEQEILRRNRELAALNTVGTVINESLDLDWVLSRALDKVLEVTEAEAAEIFLVEECTGDLTHRAFRGLFPDAFMEMVRFRMNEGIPGQIAYEAKPLVVHDLQGNPRFLRQGVKDAGFRSFAGVPLKSKGKVIGVLGIASLNPTRLIPEDVDLLNVLGNQIGIAVENARLYAQLKEMALLEERQRIAREMHDCLAQDLGYLILMLRELESGSQSYGPRKMREQICRLRNVVVDAYEEVRQAILGLNVMVSKRLGLVPTLTEYLHQFSDRAGIAVELQIVDERATDLAPQVEVQLIRIIQEALANIRKHAQVRHAHVVFDTTDGKARVTVQDLGRGFVPGQTGKSAGRPSFGLEAMNERAESVGGALKVQSEPGKGTRVVIEVPLGQMETASWSP